MSVLKFNRSGLDGFYSSQPHRETISINIVGHVRVSTRLANKLQYNIAGFRRMICLL